MTDVGDNLCWWQVSDLDDQFIDDRFTLKNYQNKKSSHPRSDSVTNTLSPTLSFHQNHSVTPCSINCLQSNFRFFSQNFTVAIFHISFSKYSGLYKMLYDSYIQAYLIFPSSVSVFHLIQPTQDWTGWKRFSSFSWFW